MILKDKITIAFIILSLLLIIFTASLYNKKTDCPPKNLSEVVTEAVTETVTETDSIASEVSSEAFSEDTSDTYCETTTAINRFNRNLCVHHVRMDHSFKNKDNSITAYLYYDKPVLEMDQYDDAKAIEKINNFLENEYLDWLNGDCNKFSHYQYNETSLFIELFEGFKDCFTDEYISRHPFNDFITFETMYSDDKILSIRQNEYWYSGGPSHICYFGNTFNLNTGELLSLEDLTGVNADDFRNKLFNYIMETLIKNYCSNNYHSSELYNKYYNECYTENYEIYAPNENHDFKLGSLGEPWDLNYDYYYDGEYYYIILRDVYPLNYKFMLKWSGKMEDDFEGRVSYELNRETLAFEKHES